MTYSVPLCLCWFKAFLPAHTPPPPRSSTEHLLLRFARGNCSEGPVLVASDGVVPPPHAAHSIVPRSPSAATPSKGRTHANLSTYAPTAVSPPNASGQVGLQRIPASR